MKMYSKEGQCMVDVKKLELMGEDIVMTAKLMGAYSMKIYLRPQEMREALKLLDWEVVSAIPGLFIKGTKGEDTLRTIGQNMADTASKDMKLLLGPNGAERIREAGKAIGMTTLESLFENALLLLQVILENKDDQEKKR